MIKNKNKTKQTDFFECLRLFCCLLSRPFWYIKDLFQRGEKEVGDTSRPLKTSALHAFLSHQFWELFSGTWESLDGTSDVGGAGTLNQTGVSARVLAGHEGKVGGVAGPGSWGHREEWGITVGCTVSPQNPCPPGACECDLMWK